jgi:hypothetical protein
VETPTATAAPPDLAHHGVLPPVGRPWDGDRMSIPEANRAQMSEANRTALQR